MTKGDKQPRLGNDNPPTGGEVGRKAVEEYPWGSEQHGGGAAGLWPAFSDVLTTLMTLLLLALWSTLNHSAIENTVAWLVSGILLIPRGRWGASVLFKRLGKFFDHRSATSQPPLNAELLFHIFMTPQNCDAILGDLKERYKLIHKTFGRRRANYWYWTQVVVSLRPIAWACVKKVSGWSALTEYWRKMGS
jgi:hypothetical protein